MQYIDNIKKWTRASLEENVRLTEDRAAWRERSCAFPKSVTMPSRQKEDSKPCYFGLLACQSID